MKVIKLFKKRHGAVSIFLVIILVPVLIMSCLFVDVSRAKLAGSLVSSAGDLTLNTVLTQYDPILNDYYGLLASCQNMDEFLATADEYFMTCIKSQGTSTEDSRKYTDMIMGMIQGDDSEIVDLLQLNESDTGKFTVSVAENGTLVNPALMKKEIVEFMKYRAPINMVSDIIERFRDCSKSMENAENDADLTDRKQKFFESESALMEEALKVYDYLLQYKDLNISTTDIAEMKKILEDAEELYKRMHTKMVMDLYNTQNKSFSKEDINLKYKVSDGKIKKDQINGYIRDTAKSIQEFIKAAEKWDNTYRMLPKYESGTVYDIQYFVACVDILNQNDSYKNFAKKANSLCKNMANLRKAMELLEDEKKLEIYILSAFEGVNTQGEKSRVEHYDALEDQYDELINKYCGVGSSYNVITNRLSEIQEQNRDNMDPQDTNQQIQDFYNRINGYASKYEGAYSLIDESISCLENLKKLVKEYQADYEAWYKKAKSYDSELSSQDREYLEKKENKEILEKVTIENVDQMIQRLNNIKDLIDHVKESVDQYKYNEYPVGKIDSYTTMRSKSGVDETKISYITSELNQYAETSFRFTSSDAMKNIRITDDNNPAIDQVNTPELYKWMKEKFKEYEKDRKNNETNSKKESAKNQKDELKKQYENINKEYGNYNNGNEIQEQENLPSNGLQKQTMGDIISNDISKISSFVTNLFSDFGATVSRSLVSLRDDLYTLDYIMSMFSYDTFEYEGKYKMCEGVTLENWELKYSEVDEKWKNKDVTFSKNKTLTNKMIDYDNNYAYGNEVEYILCGKSNKENKSSVYGTIFAMRYVLNLPAEFARYWNTNNPSEDAIQLKLTAEGIQAASYGTIPAALVQVIVILGLTAAESARDLMYLQKGMPLKLIKKEDDLEIHYPFYVENGKEKKQGTDTFFYSDYVKLILFLKLTAGDENAIYARIADVVQVNMNEKVAPPFQMSNANVYYKATANLTVEPLMLKLPIVGNSGYDVPKNGGWNSISYEAVRGY